VAVHYTGPGVEKFGLPGLGSEKVMSLKGFSHVALTTLDMNKTKHFYEHVLGFKAVVHDHILVEGGGAIRHVFFDVGRDQLIAFMAPREIPDVPAIYETGINQGLGVPASFYHFAFEVPDQLAGQAR
jgi:catechol 2,3-dioxygenase-like lactoylglutathione lyase family enzyme